MIIPLPLGNCNLMNPANDALAFLFVFSFNIVDLMYKTVQLVTEVENITKFPACYIVHGAANSSGCTWSSC